MKAQYIHTLPPEWQAMSKVFTALGDEHRQRIVLLFDKNERLNAGQIAEGLPLTRSTVSHHLKILREAGVLAVEKVGKEMWFQVNRAWMEETFQNVLDYLHEHY
ncbi:MAG: metalloregulator ArsR/SmtB family transcription factor [Zoogloeaceae bacterium]|jgi:DNA-binding transcriptional ArsR family regulator|nr:metalloregulator ArsR/SmtB family transcription factor [Zoogloeaceae bacterium]